MHSGNDSCKNCGSPISGNYCAHCGQQTDIHRINWHHLAHSLSHSMLHVDGGIFFTLKEVLIRPGHAARAFLQGKRKPYTHPMLILIIVLGLCSLVYAAWHIPTFFGAVRLDNLEKVSPTLAHKFFAFRVLYLILLCSAGNHLLFRKQGYYFPEMILFNCFLFCGIMLIQLLMAPLRYAMMDSGIAGSMAFLQLLLQSVYFYAGNYQFFEAAGNRSMQLRILLAMLLYLLLIAITGYWVVRPVWEAIYFPVR